MAGAPFRLYTVRALGAVLVVALLVGVTFVGNSPPAAPSVSGPVAPAPASVASMRGSPGAALLGKIVTAAGWPQDDWGFAYILYGSSAPTSFLGEGAGMVIDNALRNITVFGGLGAGGLTNDTMNYNYSSGNLNLDVQLPSPTPRTNSSFASVPGRNFAVLFGGLTNVSRQTTTNDTWVYYFANATWRNVTHGLAPPPRQSAAFAVNASGTALLQGGWDPDYSVNGSTASVIWNDTWSLNLTTFTWTQLHPQGAPPPLYGSVMLWQNVTDRFELFGGCALGCSNALYTYAGVPAAWRLQSTTGVGPSPRAASAFAWNPIAKVVDLQGGFNWNGGGATALGDGFYLNPATSAWNPIAAGGGPGPRFDAPNAYADFPGCLGLNVVGGNIVLQIPPPNYSVLEPVVAPQPNCFPDFVAGVGGTAPPICSVPDTAVQVQVVDNLTGQGVPHASVAIDGACITRTASTNAAGFLNLSIPAPDRINFTATASGYRDHEVVATILPNVTNRVAIPLGPLPSLRVRTYSLGVGGVVAPLADVTVYQGTTLFLGRSNAGGWLNVTSLYVPNGTLEVVGNKSGYSDSAAWVRVPYGGPVYAALTLQVSSALELQFLDSSRHLPVPGTTAVLTNIDPGAGQPLSIVPDAAGWFNLSSVPADNFTVVARAPGYFPTTVVVHHLWIAPTLVIIDLTPEVGAILHVEVTNSVTGLGIPSASVALVGLANQSTDPNGWANFTAIHPAGLYEVVASATGYESNSSWVALAYDQVVARYEVPLVPILACPGGSGCPAARGTTPPGFGYLGPPGFDRALLLASPVVLLGIIIAYVAYAAAVRPSATVGGRGAGAGKRRGSR
ncbi:MAG: Kelch repeat-containing protein [Thermoplasmata archaeon]